MAESHFRHLCTCESVFVERDRQRAKEGAGERERELHGNSCSNTKWSLLAHYPSFVRLHQSLWQSWLPSMWSLPFEELFSTSIVNIEHILHVVCICREYCLGFMPLLAADNRMDDLCSSIWLFCKNPICLSMFSCFFLISVTTGDIRSVYISSSRTGGIHLIDTISNTKLAKLDSRFSPIIHKVF